jgi:hypothetical protein
MTKREEHQQRQCEEEDRIRAEYQEAMENSVDFEKRIRNKWREKSKQKDERVAELEAKVKDLERRLPED